MDDNFEALVIDVRASTDGFTADLETMRRSLDTSLLDGFGRAGNVLENGLVSALRRGSLGFDDLKRVAFRALDEIASHALQSGMANLFGGPGGGGLGGLIGQSLGALVGLPGRATGGPVSPGRAYLVGENGPEVFLPTASGRIEPGGAKGWPGPRRACGDPTGCAPRDVCSHRDATFLAANRKRSPSHSSAGLTKEYPMTFWLARERRAQESTFMQRFDPRLLDGQLPAPRDGLGGVRIGPDALRGRCRAPSRGRNGRLESGTARIRSITLCWPTRPTAIIRTPACASAGNPRESISLNQPPRADPYDRGRDASGAPRTWYVRLWNYAEGTPSDAVITLPFSTLEDGYSLPGEPIYPADIDRMFISLVAPGYTPGSTAPLAARFNGSATMSRIVADGGRAILELGDVLLPPHGERMASAFDDAYNQTPARLLRAVVGLGYRDDLVHYVGMSHFMRLERQPDDALVVSQTGQLSAPASAWHENYFALARADELEVIASLSYELFDAYCPEAWKQRTASGAPALTGWVPPSTLLSPANGEAMNWLADCARAFVDLLEQTGLPVRFQIGEPWWWVTGNGEICLYDAAARAAFGGQPPVITDMRAPLGTEASALLDAAGALLAQSTTALTAAVRAAAQGPAEVLLLAFTPTILDPAMPELYRANLPSGWAAPAFDRLQLEDYDWLTAGAEALRRAAYDIVDGRLGYALANQDYLAGFVLDPADAEAFWTLIDRGLDEAAARGIARRYVWALPQVNRDGYTRLPPPPEPAMNPFDDVLLSILPI